MDKKAAKEQLDVIITKGRVHLYKPIQVAEILHRDRTIRDIDLHDLSTYRTQSKGWRDVISQQLVGRMCSSSSKFQDNLFDENATPPEALVQLGIINRRTNGGVEAYIYHSFKDRLSQVDSAIEIVTGATPETFSVMGLIDSFIAQAGLRRSIDKVYEIIVYALFSTLLDALDIQVGVKIHHKDNELITEFSDFLEKVLDLGPEKTSNYQRAMVFRAGATNAADRGLDMWANFGPAIQIKHISLSSEIAGEIGSSISADRVVIVCKACEQELICSIIQQFGQSGKIQSIITDKDLITWYDKAMKGSHGNTIGTAILCRIHEELMHEFPSAGTSVLGTLMAERGYTLPTHEIWL